MFYSQFILAKKGPLGTIWIAAHLERKLRKNQVADTDIGVSVDSILSPDVPIALRMTSHLLLGVVRIYNRKVNYLFDDCSEALLKIKQAFRSAAVDLPPEESKAPYHSITLPEKFDLDDFELPDSDIFQGNYVDHHISSREQITLQDTMEGVSYSTSKFGLDERFGDGDMSGLDLEEELFLQQIGNTENADERADPQTSFGSTSTVKQDQHLEDRAADSEAMVDGGDGINETMDYAHAPGTPGLVDEPNFSKVQEASACDDHLDSEYNLTGSTVREDADRTPYEENGYLSGRLEVEESNAQDQIESVKPTSECVNEIIKESDVPHHSEDVNDKDKNDLVAVEAHCNNHGSIEVGSEGSKGASEKDVPLLDVEVPSSIVDASNQQKSCDEVPELALEDQNGLILGDTINSSELDLVTHDSEAATETNADVAKPAFNPSNDDALKSDIYVEATDGEETAKLGEMHSVNDNSEHILKENQVEHHASGEDIVVGHVVAELPTPEKLLSVPEGNIDLHSGMMEIGENFEGLDEGDAGSKTAAGRKRTFTESTLTEQSLNSVESSRQDRIKRMAGSVPDDDDLLSSILVGRKSSILGVKPTPPPSEVTSMKRSRAAPRSSAPKRKVLMDETMVLHGDAIRQQLTNVQDIRRVRKKAPCTLSEISMIRKQHMEDETFLEPVFTGVSVELISLRDQVYDLGRIKICQKEAHDASLAQNSENVNFPESTAVTNIGNEKSDTYLETMVEFYSTSPNRRIHDMEDDKAPGKTNAAEVSGGIFSDEFLTVRDNESAEPCENHLPSESKIEEVDYTNIAVDEELKPINEGSNDSQIEHMVNAASVNESEAINACIDKDAAVLDQSKDVLSAELDFADVDREQAIENEGKEDGNECEGEIEVGSKDYILPNMAQDAAAEMINDAADDGGLEYHVQNDIHGTTYKEQLDVESPCMLQGGGSINEFENPDHSDAYQLHMVDGGTSGFDLHDRDELSYLAAGDDTEFLNVDDDDLAEMADDSMPDAEEMQYNDNTGWSSRTRAVSKYLQAAFVKEADRGRSSLSLENLLIGKSRKEASRMFFETLVLKTRDYIHVEQRNPFGDTNITPRTRLMKSDF